MGEGTKIAWCDDTFNPWIGCEKVSPGCAHCYAESTDRRWGNNRFGHGCRRTLTSDANWRKPKQWDRAAEKSGKRRLVFCASMADVFDTAVSEKWRDRLFDLIEETPHLTWLLLTKRSEEMARWFDKARPAYDNVWAGVTAENQAMWQERVPVLSFVSNFVRKTFVSVEPMIGPINPNVVRNWDEYVNWVIIGGESGTNARKFETDWAGQLVRECKRYRVFSFVKQLGANPFLNGSEIIRLAGRSQYKWDDVSEFPPELRVQEFPE